jgi:hypothetical protein
MSSKLKFQPIFSSPRVAHNLRGGVEGDHGAQILMRTGRDALDSFPRRSEKRVTPLFRRHSTEWGTDLLFKKPWTLSNTKEVMVGIGPEWIHSNTYGIKMNSVAGEIVPDLMFWASKKHRFGWYLEPSYEYKFGPGHEHSLELSGGLLIGIP